VAQYAAGELDGYAAVVYLGSTFDEPLPTPFLNDVLAGSRPVLWVGSNIWQLVSQDPTFAADFGFTTTFYDTSPVSRVDYKGTALTRDLLNGGGIVGVQINDPTRAQVLATAVKGDGSTIPWAVRGANLTYVGESPFSYVTGNDRYLAFADLLFDLLAPSTPRRGRPAGEKEQNRLNSAFTLFSRNGLGTPTVFEPPHYAASAVDYQTIAGRFTTRYDRGLYFGGLLSGGPIVPARLNGQYFPYAVRDLRRNLVVRDGFASFFYHPYLGTPTLAEVVDGLTQLGYTFVPAPSVGT
jgi:uncharacterized protein YdaL